MFLNDRWSVGRDCVASSFAEDGFVDSVMGLIVANATSQMRSHFRTPGKTLVPFASVIRQTQIPASAASREEELSSAEPDDEAFSIDEGPGRGPQLQYMRPDREAISRRHRRG